jgi:glycosyltransferase involved in cell wall biosynthesis
MPNISVITSTYNRSADFLPKCIASVKAQKGISLEHIIVDDGSTDGTEEYVRKVMKTSKKIRYYKMKMNTGSDTKPKNFGLSKAMGGYVLFLDDDVTLRKGALSALHKHLKETKSDVVYGDMWLEPSGEPGIAMDFDLQMLSLRNYIDTSAALMKKSCAQYVGGFDTTLPKFVDWNFFIRMAKAGFKFTRLEKLTFNYYLHEDTKSQRVKTQMYNHPKLGPLFVPTFDPVGCKIRLDNFIEPRKPRVAIFTIHYDRIEYSKETYKEMKETAGYDFDWFCVDNGSDGTNEWLKTVPTKYLVHYPENVGLTRASNRMIDAIENNQYDIIIKIDNDVEFITYGWLQDIVNLWEKNHLIYISPYVEGLLHNPGGALRIGRALIGTELVEITKHIGGIFAAIDAKAYKNFRWRDKITHGYQDLEASTNFIKQGYMPCYYPKHVIRHRDGTEGQQKKYKSYFERRKQEKVTVAPREEQIR